MTPLAGAVTRGEGPPWVLDSVAAGALGWRTTLAQRLLAEARPTIGGGNVSEILALSGGKGGWGVKLADSPEAAGQVAMDLADEQRAVGRRRERSDRPHHRRQANGPRLQQPSLADAHHGVGCALGALMAAFVAVVPDTAAAPATATLPVAADATAEKVRGPGGFSVVLLHNALIEPQELTECVRIS